MAKDDDWGDVESVPTKSQVPKLLFCGLGCFLPILMMIVVFTWIGSSIQRGRDATRQWAELQARLPHSERPDGWRLLFGFQPGGISWLLSEEVFVFTDAPEGEGVEGGRMIILIWTDDDLAEMFDTSLDGVSPYRVPPPPEQPGGDAADETPELPAGEGAEGQEGEGEGEPPTDPATETPEPTEPTEPELLDTLEVQGRACPIVLLEGEDGAAGWFTFGADDDVVGPAVAIDLTPGDSTRKLVLIGQSNAEDPMDLGTLQGFLGAFDFGPEDDPGGEVERGPDPAEDR